MGEELLFGDWSDLFEVYADVPVMREAARRFRRGLVRSRYRDRPLCGAFYWLPVLTDNGSIGWHLATFYRSEITAVSWPSVWPHIGDTLKLFWPELSGWLTPESLPRGIVEKTADHLPLAEMGFVIRRSACLPVAASDATIHELFQLPRSTPVVVETNYPTPGLKDLQVRINGLCGESLG